MKKILLLSFLVSIFFTNYSIAQELWGLTVNGGSTDQGNIYSIDLGSNYSQVDVHHDFDANVAEKPYGRMRKATNGKMYGASMRNIIGEGGVLFEFNPENSTYRKLVVFAGASFGDVIEVDNILYGMTINGGANDAGTIFTYNLILDEYNIVHHFDGINGKSPMGGFNIYDSELYGMTSKGGTNDDGVIFCYNVELELFEKKIDLESEITGATPTGSFTKHILPYAPGFIYYATTKLGGENNKGTIISYQPMTNSLIRRADFSEETGSEPMGDLLEINGDWGIFYGMTTRGGNDDKGTIFKYNLDIEKVHDFDNINGGLSIGSLINWDMNYMYGVSQLGGEYGFGVIFKIHKETYEYTILASLQSNEGARPTNDLILHNDHLYTTCFQGGEGGNNGSIISLDLATNDLQKHLDFGFVDNGRSASSELLVVQDYFYGTCYSGGNSDDGIIYRVSAKTNVFEKVFDFNSSINGKDPKGSLATGSSFEIYGTCLGGDYGHGLLYKYNTLTNTLIELHHFNGTDGRAPEGVILSPDNILLGMTGFGGENDFGTIFSYDLNSNEFTKMIDFNGTNGRYPAYQKLLFLSQNSIVGMTNYGGDNDAGVIFEYNLSSGSFQKLFDFDENVSGKSPIGGLLNVDSKLYGCTKQGGSSSSGVLFSYDLDNDTYSKLHDFNHNNGYSPEGNLILAKENILYGICKSGGAYRKGNIFAYNLESNQLNEQYYFQQIYGAHPVFGLVKYSNTMTWDGSESESWNIADNWEEELIPHEFSNVIIPTNTNYSPTVSDNRICNNITIQSDENGTASLMDNGKLTVNGTSSISRFIFDRFWHIIGSPVEDANAGMFNGLYMQTYDDESNNWAEVIDPNTPLVPMKGYTLFKPDNENGETYTFEGDLNTGEYSYHITNSSSLRWHMMSNPYPSSIDWDLVNKTHIRGEIHYWKPSEGTYFTYNGGMGNGSQFIPPMQGFFVSSASEGNVVFDNTIRTHEGADDYFKEKEYFNDYLDLKVYNQEYTDHVFMRFTNDATLQFDDHLDAHKILSNIDNVPQIYFIQNEENLSINCLPESSMIDLGFSSVSAGEYTIAIEEVHDLENLVLEDKVNQVKTELDKKSYTFQYALDDDPSRFVLHFNYTNVDELSMDQIKIYASGSTVYISQPYPNTKSKLRVFDLSGIQIQEYQLQSSNNYSIELDLSTGCYIVEYSNGVQVKSEKVIIY